MALSTTAVAHSMFWAWFISDQICVDGKCCIHAVQQTFHSANAKGFESVPILNWFGASSSAVLVLFVHFYTKVEHIYNTLAFLKQFYLALHSVHCYVSWNWADDVYHDNYAGGQSK